MNWIGALLVVTASYYCGVLVAESEKKRLEEVELIISLLSYMRRRMSVERMSLYRIFESFRAQNESEFLEILTANSGDASLLWKEAVALLSIDADLKCELLIFGESLGKLPMTEQIKRLDSCTDVLIKGKDRLKSELPARQKSRRTVCLLFGLMTAIILL